MDRDRDNDSPAPRKRTEFKILDAILIIADLLGPTSWISERDSPMRDDERTRVAGSQVDENEFVRRSPDRHDRTSTGFTAVNGDNHANAPSRPGPSAEERTSRPDHEADRQPTPSQPQFHSHGWRPIDPTASEKTPPTQPIQETGSTKRKRSVSIDTRGDRNREMRSADPDGKRPGKRQMTSNLDSAIDLTSPATHDQPQATDMEHQLPESATSDFYSR